jgi:regulator of sigma E protease
MTLLIVILFFSLLIIVHEAGHFLAAKKSGMRVDEFGVGYPPRVIGIYKGKKSKKRFNIFKIFKSNKENKPWHIIFGTKPQNISNRTIYSINLIPFGGFVRIFGQDREEKAASQKDSFCAQSALKRSIVLLSGVAANFIFAIFLLSIMFAVGAPVVSQEHQTEGLKDEQVMIASISKDTPAEKVGLQMGDKITKLQKGNDIMIVTQIVQIQQFVEKYQGEQVTLFIERGDEKIQTEILARQDFPEDQGPLGISLVKSGILAYPWYQAIWKGFLYSFQLLGMIVIGFYNLFKTLLTKGEMIGEIAGPVGIFRITGQMATLGWSYFLHFAALISINLVVLNALPLPALDGGRFLFVLIEKIKGSPVNAKTERIVNSVGFALIILLMIFVTIRDIVKIF